MRRPSAMLDYTAKPKSGGRVLLVEDVDAMRLYLRLTLENNGFEVTEAANLKEARDCFQSGKYPETVLLDLELPDGHGLDIIRELPSDVAVVAISADDSSETEMQCLRAGCIAVLSKNEGLNDISKILVRKEHQPSRIFKTTDSNPELARQYDTYLAEVRIDLQRALDTRSFDRARKIAHRLRGTAVHFGYTGISASALTVTQALASGDIDQIRSSVEELIARLVDANADFNHE